MHLTLWSRPIVDCIKFARGPSRALMIQFTRRRMRLCYDALAFWSARWNSLCVASVRP